MSLRAQDAPATTEGFGTSDSASVIDRHSDFDGTYSTDRDLRIEGKASGKLRCQGTLHVAQGATVNAEIEAEQVIVAGLLEGTVNCRSRLQIMPSGEVKGRITTPSLIISEGARYEGQMEMPSQNSRLSSGRPATALDSRSSGEETGDEGGPEAIPARTTGGGNFIRRFGSTEPRDMDAGQGEADTSESNNES